MNVNDKDKELALKIQELTEKISVYFKKTQEQTMRISLSALQEQEYKDYFQHIEREVLPLLIQLYKSNSVLAEQCVNKYILNQYHKTILDRLTNPTINNLNDSIINDIKKSSNEFYREYKKSLESLKNSVKENPSLLTMEDFDLDFTNLDNSLTVTELNPEELFKQKAIKLKIDKFIKPFIENNKTKLIMLTKNDFNKLISLIIQLQSRDLQLSVVNKEYNPTLYALVKSSIKHLYDEQKKTNKPFLNNLILKYFFLKHDPSDPTQEKKLPIKVIADAILELNLKELVDNLFI